jgi:hypothetical protein
MIFTAALPKLPLVYFPLKFDSEPLLANLQEYFKEFSQQVLFVNLAVNKRLLYCFTS